MVNIPIQMKPETPKSIVVQAQNDPVGHAKIMAMAVDLLSRTNKPVMIPCILAGDDFEEIKEN